MAGLAHDVLIQALRDDPQLLRALLLRLAGRRLPQRISPIDSVVRFTRGSEVRPDVAYRVGRTWLLCEVQNKPDPLKRCKWILAAAILHDRTGRMGEMFVITASLRVARWAKRVAHVRGPVGTSLRLSPVVLLLDAACCQRLLDPEKPELALCAAWGMQKRHGKEAARIVERAIEVTERLPPALRMGQKRAIFDVLSDRMRSRLREAAMHPDRVPERPATRKLRLFLEAMGEKRGRAEGMRRALVTVLHGRGFRIMREQRDRIDACTNIRRLDTWLARAIEAQSVADVLGPNRSRPKTAVAAPKRPSPRKRA